MNSTCLATASGIRTSLVALKTARRLLPRERRCERKSASGNVALAARRDIVTAMCEQYALMERSSSFHGPLQAGISVLYVVRVADREEGYMQPVSVALTSIFGTGLLWYLQRAGFFTRYSTYPLMICKGQGDWARSR